MNWTDKKNVLAILAGFLFLVVVGKFIGMLRPKGESNEDLSISVAKKEIASLQTREMVEIKIRKGWCLSKIAEGCGTSVADLVKINQIKNPNLIYAGQILKVIPYKKVQEVKVSWYGPECQGNTMSNGQIFDMEKPDIVAHKYLPFGTRIKLTRKDNQKSIVLIVQDRGPYIDGRHFDISLGAAKVLEIVGIGVATCKVEILK